MVYLYGIKANKPQKLVATFETEPFMLSYIGWATLKTAEDGTKKFEQGSPLVGCTSYEYSREPLTNEDVSQVPHSPSPSML